MKDREMVGLISKLPKDMQMTVWNIIKELEKGGFEIEEIRKRE